METKTDWSRPQSVDRLTLAFGARISHLMPSMSEIPDEFKRSFGTPWNHWQAKWFFRGLTEKEFPTAKPGIDQNTAIEHLTTIQASFEPKHEHKEAAVAYLASLWFEAPPK